MLRSLAFVLAIAVGARAIGAQFVLDSVHHRETCHLAEQVMLTGNPAPKMRWAVQAIYSCGDQVVIGKSIAAALTRLRYSTDTAQLLPLKYATFGLTDGSIYSAAFAISADNTASPAARAVSLLILVTQLHPDNDVSFAELLSATLSETERCGLDQLNDVRVSVGPVPLPGEAKTQTATLARGLQRDSTLPILIRVAARCAVEAATSP